MLEDPYHWYTCCAVFMLVSAVVGPASVVCLGLSIELLHVCLEHAWLSSFALLSST